MPAVKDPFATVSAFIAAAPTPAVLVDESGIVKEANEEALRLIDRDSIQEVEIGDVFGEEVEHLTVSGRPGTVEVTLGPRTLVVNVAPVEKGAALLLFTDISTYEKARRDAEMEAQSRSDFLARLSHEIRSAVATMIGFSEMLHDNVSGENAELAELITSSGRHLVDTLNSVMDLAQVEFDDAEIETCSVDLVRRVSKRVDVLRPLADRKGIDLVFESDDVDVAASLNPTYFDRAVHNLIDNAIKYTEKGTVEVEVEARDGAAWLYVADTGQGIDEKFLPKLFSPFERERRSDSPMPEGVGLGLAVTKYLVELMGGQIFACSTKGHGSTFTVRFPLEG